MKTNLKKELRQSILITFIFVINLIGFSSLLYIGIEEPLLVFLLGISIPILIILLFISLFDIIKNYTRLSNDRNQK